VSDTVALKNERRSERVMLRVAVLPLLISTTARFISEPTFTQVVNAHGGLFTLRTAVASEQKFPLKNLNTGMVRQCSVVRTERDNNELLVAHQFATPAPDFWPIRVSAAMEEPQA